MNRVIQGIMLIGLVLILAACGRTAVDDGPAPETAVINGVRNVDAATGTAELNVSALDADGRAVQGDLTHANVSVTDVVSATGSNLGSLQSLSATARICRNIQLHGAITGIISLDASGSMSWNDNTLLRADAAKQFVDGISPADRIAIASFTTGADYSAGGYVIHEAFTGDKAALYDGIDEATFAGGSTPLWASSQNLITNELDVTESNKVLLVLTDGADTGGATPQDVIDAAQAEDVRVYFVGLGNPSNLNQDQMNDIANTTGGLYSRTDDPAGMADLFGRVLRSSTASGEICVTFSPTPVAPGTVVSGVITMTVNGREYTADYEITF